jgi:hypothetical protein
VGEVPSACALAMNPAIVVRSPPGNGGSHEQSCQERRARMRARAPGQAQEGFGRRTIERRAVEAEIRGVPTVSIDAIGRAFRGVGAKCGDIASISEPAEWRQ